MLIDFDSGPGEAEFNADLCIVGAGAAGITLAMELMATGKQILLVEAGGLSYSEDSQSLYHMARDRLYWDPYHSRVRQFGGSTNHWEGSCRAFDRIDFERRSWVADSGWPFSYDDLLPYYDRAFPYVEIGPRQENEAEFLRELGSSFDKLSQAGFAPRLGYSSPPTRFGRKYLEPLRAAPNLTILTRANLLSIDEAPDRNSVTSLTVANYKQHKATIKARYFVIALGGIENARALLLSNSVTPEGIGNERDLVGRYFMDHPVIEAAVFYPSPGLKAAWNSSWTDEEGHRYSASLQANEAVLREHQLSNARMPLAEANTAYTSMGIESAHQIEKAIAKGVALRDVLMHLQNTMNDADLILDQWRRQHGYSPLYKRSDTFGGYVMQMMLEQRPDKDNRIVLTDARDALGLRKGRIQWRLPQSEKDDFKRLIALFAKGAGTQGLGIVRSLLATDDMNRRFEELMNFGHHHMGSTRASVDPKTGVVDGDFRIHGRENIYMAGSSTFPTGGNVPPTTTIVATAIRLADHLKGRIA